MTSHEHEFSLPRVEEDDLLKHVFEDATDPRHGKRWQTFAHSNRLLAREVLKRIHVSSGANPDLQKVMLDEITYVYAALTTAALRLSAEQQSPIAVDDDVEYPQPSV